MFALPVFAVLLVMLSPAALLTWLLARRLVRVKGWRWTSAGLASLVAVTIAATTMTLGAAAIYDARCVETFKGSMHCSGVLAPHPEVATSLMFVAAGTLLLWLVLAAAAFVALGALRLAQAVMR